MAELILEPQPCPFCRGQSVVMTHLEEGRPERHRVACKSCHALGPVKDTAQGAIRMWNRATLPMRLAAVYPLADGPA